MGKSEFKPTSNFVGPLLTDLYQISMAYSYFMNNKHEQHAVFDLFFRTAPFKGEFAIFAGLEECLRYVHEFKFTEEEITYLRNLYGDQCDERFFDYLATVDCSAIKLYAIPEGTVVFPREPLIRVEGPVLVCQLLETALLNLVNYPSLVATNAARHRISAGDNIKLIEFGLRRAQGPDGAMSATKYSYLGGFDGSSNVQGGKYFGIHPSGTHAHAFVSSFIPIETLSPFCLKDAFGVVVKDFEGIVRAAREHLNFTHTDDGELLAFTAYARAFPRSALLLVDTYDTVHSGIPNFLTVAYALHKIGYQARGIRLDSGDLAYLSRVARDLFRKHANSLGIDYFANFEIVASNDITVETIQSLNQQHHEINTFGIGTNLVTCSTQPALGCVFKLVEIDDTPRIKLSEEIAKVTIPCKKNAYRLYVSGMDYPFLDILMKSNEKEPQVGEKILCRHPFAEHKRIYVTPTKVEPLHRLFWDEGKLPESLPTLEECRARARKQLFSLREDHIRLLNPTPYKISVSSKLFDTLKDLWLSSTPIPEV